MNTIYALWTSVTFSIWTSKLCKLGKFSVDHIINATLAGGVMIAASANLFTIIYPSFIIGALAGIWSTISFNFFAPCFPKWKLYDIRGVMHLHGTVGIFGGIISSIVIATIKDHYGSSTEKYFPY